MLTSAKVRHICADKRIESNQANERDEAPISLIYFDLYATKPQHSDG